MAEHSFILKSKGEKRNLVIFQDRPMESSHRDLLNNMAEHSSILKNKQNTHFSLTFQDRPMFSHINGKLSTRPYEWYS